VTWGDGRRGITGVVSPANSLVGSNPHDFVGGRFEIGGDRLHPAGYIVSNVLLLSNGNFVILSPFWNSERGAVTWGSGNKGITGVISDDNSLVGNSARDLVGAGLPSPYSPPLPTGDFPFPTVTVLRNGNYLVESPRLGNVTWVSGSSGQTWDGRGTITPQNSVPSSKTQYYTSDSIIENSVDQTILVDSPGQDRIGSGFANPGQPTYGIAPSQDVTMSSAFLTRTLNTGTAVVLRASNDITVNSPITVSAGGHGGALTLEAGRSINLSANITTDNGALTLIANDELANGVVDSQRDPGNAAITMAPGTSLDTGAGNLTVELRDGAGLSHPDSVAITLQTVSAGSVWVSNDGPSVGSDVQLGTVTSSGSQFYANPHGITRVTGNLTAADSSIRFSDAVAVSDGVAITAGTDATFFAGSGLQAFALGSGSRFGNVNHTGSGTLQVSSGLNMTGSLINQAGIFDANNEPVSVTGMAAILDGTYRAGTAPQNFSAGVTIAGGVFTSSGGPMNVSGGITLVGGLLRGVGSVDTLTARGGSVAPGSDAPGVLTVGGAVTLNAATTVSILLNGLAVGSGYSQLVVGGPLDLGGSTLSLTFGFVPPVGSSFEILSNTGSAPIRGTFNGLAEGAVFTASGYQFQITYQGGTSRNSVVLTRLIS
jgi:hypothetical protein